MITLIGPLAYQIAEVTALVLMLTVAIVIQKVSLLAMVAYGRLWGATRLHS